MRRERLILLLPPIMLLAAILDGLPYSYFRILRWVVFVFSALSAFAAYGHASDSSSRKNVQMAFCLLFAMTTILFNPFLIIRLQRDIWQVIDIAVGILFLLFAIVGVSQASISEMRHDDGDTKPAP